MKRLAAILVAAALMVGAWFMYRQAKPAPSSVAPSVGEATAPSAHRTPEYPDSALESRLTAMVSRTHASCGIVAKNLRSGAIARVNSDLRVPLMSVVKLPVALVVLDGVDEGRR